MTREDTIEEEVKAVPEPTQETVEEVVVVAESTVEYLSSSNPLTVDRFRAKCRELNWSCPDIVLEGFHATIEPPTLMTQTSIVPRTTNANPVYLHWGHTTSTIFNNVHGWKTCRVSIIATSLKTALS